MIPHTAAHHDSAGMAWPGHHLSACCATATAAGCACRQHSHSPIVFFCFCNAAGQRMSGSVSYHYVTMTFTPDRLPAALNKINCPSLESIINQAYSAGIGPHDNDLISRFANDAAAQHSHTPAHLVGQAAPELAQMSPFGRRLQQFGRWLPRIQLTPLPSPPAQSPPPSPPPPPSPAAPTPSPETKPAAASPISSDKPAAGDSKAAPGQQPAEKSADKTADAESKLAEQQQQSASSDSVDIVSTRQPADSQQEPEQQQEQQQAPAETPPVTSSPTPEQVATPVAIQPPTTDQLLGPHKKADEPAPAPAPAAAADKPADQETPKPAAAAPADKPAEAQTPKPAAPAADAPKEPADKTPAPTTPEPAKETQSQAAPGTIPIPQENDENVDADGSSEQQSAAQPPAPAAAATPAPVPAVLGPSVPASQAADVWRHQQEQQAADSIHQQLAAHNGYLVPTDPAAAAPEGQAWAAYPGSTAMPGGYPAGGEFGDAPPQFKVTFMFGFSHNKTFAYGRGRVVSAPAGSIKYTVEAQNWCVAAADRERAISSMPHQQRLHVEMCGQHGCDSCVLAKGVTTTVADCVRVLNCLRVLFLAPAGPSAPCTTASSWRL